MCFSLCMADVRFCLIDSLKQCSRSLEKNRDLPERQDLGGLLWEALEAVAAGIRERRPRWGPWGVRTSGSEAATEEPWAIAPHFLKERQRRAAFFYSSPDAGGPLDLSPPSLPTPSTPPRLNSLSCRNFSF